MVENPQVDKTPYLLKLAGRSLGLEGFELAQNVCRDETDARKTTTLLYRLSGVPIAILNFLCPSIYKAIMDDTIIRDEEAFDMAGAVDATSNSLAAIAALVTGAYTRNTGIGIATYLATRTMINAMTHIGRDLSQQINPDNGLV